MNGRIVIDGNAFYEVDEECIRRKREAQELEDKKKDNDKVIKNRLK